MIENENDTITFVSAMQTLLEAIFSLVLFLVMVKKVLCAYVVCVSRFTEVFVRQNPFYMGWRDIYFC